MNERLQVDLGELPTALVARPVGDIDLANADAVRADVLALAERHGPGCLVVDLGAVTYLDSSGIELLFGLHQVLGDSAELFVVAPPDSNAARAIELVALADIGEVRPSLQEALDACADRTASQG